MPKFVKLSLYMAVPILLMAGLINSCVGPFNHFPGATLKAIASDSHLIFYSIDPSEGPKTATETSVFHDWTILGQTTLSRPEDRAVMIESLRRAARFTGRWSMAACFNPRHAIRATDSTGTYDVVLCFECGQAAIYLPNGKVEWIPIHGSSETFDGFLKAAHVPLARRN